MIYSPSEVLPIAVSTGFRAEMIEKVLHPLNLLDKLNRHPMLRNKWVLKGGTALNLFVFDLPRLSVDIDLNYVGVLEREAMLADRPKVEQAAQAVFSREGFTTKRVPEDHAGGKRFYPLMMPSVNFWICCWKRGRSMPRSSRPTKRFKNASKASRFSNGRPLT